MTNAEMIAKQGGQGVIEFFIKTYTCCPYIGIKKEVCTKQMSCLECWCEWLKQEATDENETFVNVIRCKDCRYFTIGDFAKYCSKTFVATITDENGFCHHGKRRVDNG